MALGKILTVSDSTLQDKSWKDLSKGESTGTSTLYFGMSLACILYSHFPTYFSLMRKEI